MTALPVSSVTGSSEHFGPVFHEWNPDGLFLVRATFPVNARTRAQLSLVNNLKGANYMDRYDDAVRLGLGSVRLRAMVTGHPRCTPCRRRDSGFRLRSRTPAELFTGVVNRSHDALWEGGRVNSISSLDTLDVAVRCGS
jgi:hypothetical protein